MKGLTRLLALAVLLAPLPLQASVTTNQLETLVTAAASAPFRQRVEFGIVLTAENVASESIATVHHLQRAALAAAVLNNPDAFVNQFSQAVVVQLPLNTTNLITVNSVPNADVDTTDATIQSDVSAIWNDLCP